MIWPRWLARIRCRHAGHFTDGTFFVIDGRKYIRCVICGEDVPKWDAPTSRAIRDSQGDAG